MRFLQMKWIVPILLLGAIYLADQIRIGRPDHKYRLTVDVETPAGVKSASGILSVRPNRSYGGTGSGSSIPQAKGDALLVDLGDGRNLVVLLAYGADGSSFEDASFLPTRVYGARDRRVGFRDIKNFAGAPAVPVPEQLRPVFVAFANASDPKSARRVDANDLEASLGKGFRLRDLSIDVRRQRPLADRCRRRARRAGDARDRSEAAVAEDAGRRGGSVASSGVEGRRGICGGGGVYAEVTA